jgi:AhpD family alkylhydroperoxidase
MTDTPPRIAPGTLAELGVINWLVCKIAARVAHVHDVHLFSTLARQRRLFRAWLRFSGQMMPGGKLSRHDTELVILRVATLRNCQYERDHHERLGQRVGIDDRVLAQLVEGPSAAAWSDAHRALLSGVDALVQTQDIPDSIWQALSRDYAPEQLIELCLLVGQYEMLATTITTLRVARDYA